MLDIILKNEPENSKLKGGDDLLREFKKSSSKAKIIVMSKIESLDMLDYIINVLNADGYILKSRTSLQEIIPAIKTVLSSENYYSKSVTKILQYQENLLDIDIKDRFILKLLSQGLRQQEIEIASPKKGIKMTVSAIEKRIKKLKLRFGAETTAQLTAIAVKKGII